jgi:predicted nucleic acid-binding protein
VPTGLTGLASPQGGAGTIVDSNVLLDLFTDDRRWSDWSAKHLARAFDEGPVLINPIIYAELSVGFDRIEDLDSALPIQIGREDLPWDAAFLAGRCFLQYRRAGGARRARLPDFYIAAHAATTGRALLTRDRPRHLQLLPSLRVISPD